MKATVTEQAYHRNGICGEPFQVSLIKDEDGTRKVAIRLDKRADKLVGAMCCFVLDVDMLAAGNITFGKNSWRGDRYADLVSFDDGE